jgi:hypothetical protein
MKLRLRSFSFERERQEEVSQRKMAENRKSIEVLTHIKAPFIV